MKKVSKKIVLLGNEGVGKTSLVKRYVHSIFSDEYLTTIGIKISKKTVIIDDNEVNLMLWDIAGNMMSKLLYNNYLKGAHGIFLVCDALRPETYDSIIEERDEHLAKDFDIGITSVIVNKSDLIESEDQLKGMKYDYLTSAKSGDKVEEAFYEIAKRIIDNE